MARSIGSGSGRNDPRPITSLRDWLDHLAAHDRLAVTKPGIALRFELAAVAKRLDGVRATLFPKPGGHAMPVISGRHSRRRNGPATTLETWYFTRSLHQPGPVSASWRPLTITGGACR